jgi:hypothetical protein
MELGLFEILLVLIVGGLCVAGVVAVIALTLFLVRRGRP